MIRERSACVYSQCLFRALPCCFSACADIGTHPQVALVRALQLTSCWAEQHEHPGNRPLVLTRDLICLDSLARIAICQISITSTLFQSKGKKMFKNTLASYLARQLQKESVTLLPPAERIVSPSLECSFVIRLFITDYEVPTIHMYYYSYCSVTLSRFHGIPRIQTSVSSILASSMLLSPAWTPA